MTTNPLILMDLVRLLVFLWAAVFLVVAAAQQFIGDGLDKPKMLAIVWLANYLTGTAAVSFFIVSVLVLRNVFVVHCCLTPHTIVYECVKGRTDPGRPIFSFRPYSVLPPQNVRRSTRREVNWKDIRSCQDLPEMHTLLLKGKGMPPLRLYCPNKSTYDTALAYVQNRLAV